MARNQLRDKAAILKKLADVRIVEIACKQVGISRATFYRWQDDDYKFHVDCQQAIQQGTDRISDLAESQVVNKIKDGDFRASTYWLEKHHPDYAPRKTNQPDKFEDPFAKYSDEQLMMVIESTEEVIKDFKVNRIKKDNTKS